MLKVSGTFLALLLFAVIVYLTIDGEIIKTTPEHPFYTADGEWVAAGDLEVGDEIRTLDGGTGTIEAIEVVEATQPMYNLTVEDAHTFFVGAGQWLVHNTCGSWPEGWPITEKGERLADLADKAHDSAFFTHTAAVAEVNGTVYVTTNAGASATIKNNVKTWADNEGYSFIENNLDVNNLPGGLPNNHAEVFMYHYFSDKGGVDIIGVSGPPCSGTPSCQAFFTPARGVQLVYNYAE